MDNTTADPDTTFRFINPATQTPLFVAEWLTCAYPMSDLYASSPRYLYYALLVLVLVVRRRSWLVNVFLGVVATYAGIAAIQAFILVGEVHSLPEPQIVSIPFVSSHSVFGNETLSLIPNLITDRPSIEVQPAALDFDLDAILAITVTGYLMMLPVHCWSSAVGESRARHLLVLIWNALMFAGMFSSISLWPHLFDSPLQYRFCYPSYLDTHSVTSDGHYDADLWYGNWNDTVWNIFSNYSVSATMNNNCFYPCFNTSQALRRADSLVANVDAAGSSRIAAQLVHADIADPRTSGIGETNVAYLMYVALVVTTTIMLLLLVFLYSPLYRAIRVPIHRPKDFLWSQRKELFHVLWKEFQHGSHLIRFAVSKPMSAYRTLRSTPRTVLLNKTGKFLRFQLDMLSILMLFVAMILTPVTIVIFVVFIESSIRQDLVSQEAPQQVGQWSTSVSVALILVSALLLRLKYPIATENELQIEINETKEHLSQLEALLEKKQHERTAHDGETTTRNTTNIWYGMRRILKPD